MLETWRKMSSKCMWQWFIFNMDNHTNSTKVLHFIICLPRWKQFHLHPSHCSATSLPNMCLDFQQQLLNLPISSPQTSMDVALSIFMTPFSTIFNLHHPFWTQTTLFSTHWRLLTYSLMYYLFIPLTVWTIGHGNHEDIVNLTVQVLPVLHCAYNCQNRLRNSFPFQLLAVFDNLFHL